uniref:glucan endo-1,3-beta-D-glucosidase n=1 Tax=Leersia perrieri TaxID=77586 RepID=A0A0D9XTH8_9ORYZ
MAASRRVAAAMIGVVAIMATIAAVDGLGVNWGTMATHRLPPKVIARLIKDNGFKKVKIFDADATTMSGLAGTGIETMIAVPNDMLSAVGGDYGRAREWVKENVTRYMFDGGVNIRHVAVGNEPFLKAYGGAFDRHTVPALRNIQRALDEAGHGTKIKATVPVNADVYDSPASNPVPSAGRFRDDVAGLMADMVKFLNRSGAPLTVNIYPFLSLYGNDDFPIDYAFFDGGAASGDPPPKPVFDNGINYTNVFDANFDTLVSSLKKIGFGNLPIVIGEVGWPTDGDKHATVAYAQRFYSGLLKRLAARRGTPLRPRVPIDVYLFGLVDEDAKSVAPGNFERHWGIFTFDGRPKFPVDLRGGDGRSSSSSMPLAAKGVEYMKRRWCVLAPNATDDEAGRVADNVGYACAHADCTALGLGCSCGGLDARGNASYAFNVYYQAQGQAEAACDFQGLAVVTEDERDVPSQGACNFTVQVAAAGKTAAAACAAVAAAAVVGLAAVLVLV